MSYNVIIPTTIPFYKKILKPWGHEIIYTPDYAKATGKIIYVKAGHRLSLQYHDEKTETLCLISGQAKITLSDEYGKQVTLKMELEKGYYIIPQQVHRVEAITDIVFIEASTPETGNTFRLQDDANRGDETESIRNSKNRGWEPKNQ